MISRRRFLQLAALSAVPRGGRPRGREFVLRAAALRVRRPGLQPEGRRQRPRFDRAGTSIPVYGDEVVIPAAADDLLSFPFVFMTGHKLVASPRQSARTCGGSPTRAGCSSPTTATRSIAASSRSPAARRARRTS